MPMPLNRLRLDPAEWHVTFNFDEPRRDCSIVPPDKSDQFQLYQRVEKQQRHYRQYADHRRHAKSSNFQRVFPQSASLGAHLQLDEQLTFGQHLRYDAEVCSDAPASHDAPLLDDAQHAEQLQPATTEQLSTFHPATTCSTSASASAAPSDELSDATDETPSETSPCTKSPSSGALQRLGEAKRLATLAYWEMKGKCSIFNSPTFCHASDLTHVD